jgi:5-methyltetrahydrofolate--homocysteine methyltransferase
VDPNHPLLQRARERVLILDGAMGSMLQTYLLDEDGYRGTRFAELHQPLRVNNDLLNLTQPDIVRSIHRAYFEAGADLVETNTFNAQRISMADYGMESLVREINMAGARLAREAAEAQATPDRPCFVAGAIGPTNRTLSLSPDVNRPGYRATTFDKEALIMAFQEGLRGVYLHITTIMNMDIEELERISNINQAV